MLLRAGDKKPREHVVMVAWSSHPVLHGLPSKPTILLQGVQRVLHADNISAQLFGQSGLRRMCSRPCLLHNAKKHTFSPCFVKTGNLFSLVDGVCLSP